jgi:hypothetical protein
MMSSSFLFISISRKASRRVESVTYIVRTIPVLLLLIAMAAPWYRSETRAVQEVETSGKESLGTDTISFAEDVFPIIQKNCLPCHAEDNFNPSELSLDSYELLMEGGRHGDAVEPGNADESPLIQKLRDDPPFGDRMPLDLRKKKGKKSTAKPLSEEEIQCIATWIEQGAGDN